MLSYFTIDCVIVTFHEGDLKVLLTERNEYPYKDWWAIPGFFVEKDEEMEAAVKRIAYEMTGLKDIYMEQLAAFAGVKRHPEGRILTVAYLAFVKYENVKNKVKPITNYMRQAKWFSMDDLPELAFDHKDILMLAMKKLKTNLSYTLTPYELLPEKFTLTQLQQVYESILGQTLDKRNFRKKMVNLGYLKELDECQTGVSYRAARLYKVDRKKFLKLFS
ncbi:NUDIX hydrolase [Sphingobacterium sp. SGG-5]|uniref:NUDIX hydrolase n=1 Tax=Sphingobacterium sp. SGG-5 TaxID=2710881 RepID=UPI0013ECAD39|nr:NUDIX domain-containing protein [Sphingobacterium sp. SGG-5]NGM61860.1 NUDIX hydrolase [Sphingobacterium sp. SGG-5]